VMVNCYQLVRATVPRIYMVQHYSGYFCEGVLDDN